MKNLLLLLPFSLLLVGCTGMAGVAKAVANDPAFVSVRVTTIYGTGLLVRDGRPLSANTVSPDGVVTSTPTVGASTAVAARAASTAPRAVPARTVRTNVVTTPTPATN